MSLSKLLSRLHAAEVKISLVGDQLEVHAPSDIEGSGLLEEIKLHEHSLIELFRVDAGSDNDSIAPAPHAEYYDLSHAQKRLWVAHQVEEVKNTYNVFDRLVIDQVVNVEALKLAFEKLLHRHAILRTGFVIVQGEPRQKINTKTQAELQYMDYRKHEDRYERVKKLADEETLRIFDLTSDQLIVACLFQLEDDKYLFLLNMHHIICDARSIVILKNELFILYQACLEGIPAPLNPLVVQYHDYAHWHNEMIRSGSISPHRNYWLAVFRDQVPVVNLSTDLPWPAHKTYNGKGYELFLPATLSDGLRAIGQQYNASPFIVYTALVNVFLYKYTGQTDIVTGTLTEGRYNESLVGQVGFYINTLPLRTQFEDGHSFVELLERTRAVVLDAFEHQAYPFDAIVDDLELVREVSRNPLFDVLVSYTEDNSDEILSGENDFTLHSYNSKFALSFALLNMNGRLKFHIGYNTDLFLADAITRMLDNLQTLLAAILEYPNIPILQLDFIAAPEKDRLLAFNDTQTPFAENQTLHRLFELQAKDTPDAIALITPGEQWTYRQLNESANQLARLLRLKYGVTQGELVGVMMDHTFDLLTTLMAILKLGATYVPVLAENPNERIHYLLKDTGIRILATDNASRIQQPGLDRQGIVIVVVPDAHIISFRNDNLSDSSASTDIACLLYTSGSTGQPKGVMLEHKGLVNRIQWLWKAAGFSKDDIYFQKTTYAFDVSIGEIFMTLCYGARLFMAGKDFSGTPHEVAEYIRAFNITTVHFSASTLTFFLNDLQLPQFEHLRSLRRVLTSGEAVMLHTVRNYYSKLSVPLFNLYGPTEASIEVSCYETKPDDKLVPIGKPISNVKLYVLDKESRLLPIGVQGEICIGGVAVARGYFRREEQTAEKFTPDHYGEPGERIYHTGDIGKWQADGNLLYLGRRDNQTNIGGYRIELGEIESALCEHPEVGNAAVVEWTDASGDAGLIAYIEKRTPAVEKEETVPPVYTSLTSEQTLLLQEVNTTTQAFESHITFKELFERQAALVPDHTAIVDGTNRLTYRQLNETANRLSHVLQVHYQLKKGTVAGVFMPRSAEAIITILAILKTGAVYVPVDEDCPLERVQYMAGDCNMSLLIASAAIPINREMAPATLVSLQELTGHLVNASPENPDTSLAATDPVYIIYTSGSTGSPKGVMVEHGSLYNIAASWQQAYGLGQFRVSLLQMASMAFDVFTGDLCRALLNGGQLVICSKDLRPDPQLVYGLMAEYEVNILEATPSLLLPLVEYVYEQRLDLSFLRILIFGAELLLMEEYKQVVERIGHTVRVINSYGTTETTIDSSFFEAALHQLPHCAHAPIGKPMSNTRFYILDKQRQQVPPGATGELYIAGAGVARGYVNNPTLTMASFINHPIEPNGRLYKTGDLARWLPDGNVELQGRMDDQVKLRGYRIEPGEIENTLVKHPAVEKAIVLVKQDEDNNGHLVSYYTSAKSLPAKELRQHLEQFLPAYMVPSFFIRLPAFPVTVNGKVDRNLLPEPVFAGSDQLKWRHFLQAKLPRYMVPSFYILLNRLPKNVSGKIDRKRLPDPKDLIATNDQLYAAPSSPLEIMLANIWEEVLLKKRIGIDDDFFNLGGHSLKAVRIFSLINKRMSLHRADHLTIRDLYNSSTIRELAQVIQQGKTADSLLLLNRQSPANKNLYMIPPVLGSATVFKKLAEKLEGKVNCMGFMNRGFDNGEPLDNSIGQMAETYLTEIRAHANSGKVYLLGYSMGCLVAYEMARKLEEEGYEMVIILIDSPVADGQSRPPADHQQLEKEFERQMDLSFRELPPQSIQRLKEIFLHNVHISGLYKMTGILKSELLVIEAMYKDKKTSMDKWENYTRKHLRYSSLLDTHYGVIFNEGLPAIITKYLNS